MRSLIRAEVVKQRSTRTALVLLGAMDGLVLLALLAHAFGLPAESLRSAERQAMVLGRGELLGVLFATLLGAMSITAEIRHGTIRPTLLVTPRRGRVVAAKVVVSAMIGTGFGAVAAATAASVGTAALRSRGIEMRLDPGDHVQLVAGSAVAAGLWAAIGVGVGALVRDQVPTLVGICAWLLFVEGLLVGDVAAALSDLGRLLPGSAAAALSGQGRGTLLAPETGLSLLLLYAVAAAAAGGFAMSRRDVA